MAITYRNRYGLGQGLAEAMGEHIEWLAEHTEFGDVVGVDDERDLAYSHVNSGDPVAPEGSFWVESWDPEAAVAFLGKHGYTCGVMELPTDRSVGYLYMGLLPVSPLEVVPGDIIETIAEGGNRRFMRVRKAENHHQDDPLPHRSYYACAWCEYEESDGEYLLVTDLRTEEAALYGPDASRASGYKKRADVTVERAPREYEQTVEWYDRADE